MGSDLMYSPLASARSVIKAEPFSFDVSDAALFGDGMAASPYAGGMSYLPSPTGEMFFLGEEVEPMLSDAAGSDGAADADVDVISTPTPTAEDALALAAAVAMPSAELAPPTAAAAAEEAEDAEDTTPTVAPTRPKRTRRRRSGGRFTRRRRTRKRPGVNANGEVVETEVLKAQKAKHLAIERRRRDNINHQIDVLRELVPTCRCGEYKGQVLSKAVEYIQELEDALAQAHRDDASSSSSAME